MPKRWNLALWYAGSVGAYFFVLTKFKIVASALRVYLSYIPDFGSREVLICQRVDEVAIPPTPSFNTQCEQCGARIWVAHSSPIEPVRMCVACSARADDQASQVALKTA